MERDLLPAIREALLPLAKARQIISYQELALRAEIPPPHRIHKLTLALETLVREDHAAGRPLLAALAVSRGQGGIPGRGFFQLLAELKRHDGPDRGAEAERAHRQELESAWDYWGDPKNSASR